MLYNSVVFTLHRLGDAASSRGSDKRRIANVFFVVNMLHLTNVVDISAVFFFRCTK